MLKIIALSSGDHRVPSSSLDNGVRGGRWNREQAQCAQCAQSIDVSIWLQRAQRGNSDRTVVEVDGTALLGVSCSGDSTKPAPCPKNLSSFWRSTECAVKCGNGNRDKTTAARCAHHMRG